MIDLFYRFLWGWVEVTISGPRPERIISRLALSGQRLWAVSKTRAGYRFITPLAGVPVLRTIVRHEHYRVHFGRRGGWPFRWRQFITRPFLGIGALSAIALIFFTTSRIWIIDVPGTQNSTQAKTRIIQAAALAGIRPGTPRSTLNLRESRLRMERLLPQYAFIGLSMHGVLVRVHVFPRVNKPASETPLRIIAGHSGRLTNMLVYMGDPEVAPGEFVRKGQTLISGAVSAPVPVQPEGTTKPMTESVRTAAKGEVFADVRYRVFVTQPYRIVESSVTGNHFTQMFVQMNGHAPILITGYGKVPFRFYRTDKIVHPLMWQGVNLPVETVKIVYNEIQRRRVTLTKKQALARARQLAARRVDQMVHEGTKLRRHETVQWSKRGVSVQLISVVNQNIAVPVTK
ncbi:MAG: sporulation protein YqfD [Firmicutes bacterium]|nr:sporulation protein YqfD [Bacillota bacterium]MCL5013650.1 sporulation protein YqfD [Bacillota bacterium]